MRIAKRLIGWLCFLSLPGAIFCAAYWLHGVVAPYYRGAQVYQWMPPPDPSEAQRAQLVRAIEKPKESARDALAHHVSSGRWETTRQYSTWPDYIHIWLEDQFGSGEQRPRLTTAVPRSPLSSAILLDASGKPVEMYPPGPVNELEPLIITADPGQDGYRYVYLPDDRDSTTASLPASWEAVWGEQGSALLLRRIRGSDGRQVGFLASPVKDSPTLVTVEPYEARITQGVLSPDGRFMLSLVLLVTHIITLPIWVALDAGWRGMRRWPWALLVIVTGWIGLLAYLIARLPPQRPCLNCGSPVFAKYKRCPVCGVSITPRCPVCRTVMKAGWQYCPKCSGQEPQPPVIEDAVLVTEDTPAAENTRELPAKTVSLAVRVTDATSRAPLAGASVTVSGRISLDGLTKRDGVFEARRLESGLYTITASKDGYETGQVETDVAQGPQVVQIALVARPGRISGRVLDRSTLDPIAEAHVELDSTRLDRSSTSGAGGAYSLDDIPAGPYTVRAEAAGYAAQTKLVEVSPGQSASVDFGLQRCAEVPTPGEGENE